MQLFLSLLLAAGILFCPGTARCATAADPALRTATLSAGYPWTEGLILSFPPDEKQCRARYGENWQVRCAADLGEPGATEEGVRLTPPLKGHWQWRDSTSLFFVLDEGESPAPGTTYTADLSEMARPASVKIDRQRLSVRTEALSVRLVESAFWIDPSPQARHRLAFSLEFNYPVGDKGPLMTCSAPGVGFGEAERVWSTARDRLNISFPVKKPAEQDVEARLLVEGMPRFSVEDGKARFFGLSGKEKGTTFRAAVKGGANLFAVKGANLVRELDGKLDKACVLDLETTLYVSPEEVLRHLDVRQLPRFRSPSDSRPYNWHAAPVIPAQALAEGKKLTPVSLMQDDTPVARLRFRIPADPDSYLLISIDGRCAAASGTPLGREWRGVLRHEAAGASLDFLQPGNVLSLAEDNTLDLYATDLDAIRWEAQLVRDPFLALLAQGSGMAFTEPLAGTPLGLEALSESVRGEIPLAAAAPGAAQFAGLPLSPVLAAAGEDVHGLMRVQLTGIKDGKEAVSASRMVLITDLGLLLKRTALGGYEAFVHSFSRRGPAAGVRVSILGANGKPVAEGVTDAGGHAAFPSLNGLSRERQPVAAVAESSVEGRGDLAWLPLTDMSRELNYSEFPVGGRVSSPEGLSAFVFTQRGMFRPGETLHFGCVLRRADWGSLPADLPLVAEVRNPLGKLVMKRGFTAGRNGMSLFDWPSPATAPTGNYLLSVRTADSANILGTAVARVEEFQPDTLSLKLERPTARGWLAVSPDALPDVRVRLKNLYGAPAAGHKVRGYATLAPARLAFAGFEEFTFDDPAPFAGTVQGRDLPETRTDAEGAAVLTFPAGLAGRTSARCTVLAEGFEADGGRAATAQTSFLVSPRTSMLGYRPLGALTNLQFIPQNARAELEFVAVDPDLQRISLEGLTFAVALRRYATSLVQDGNGDFRYDETPVDVPFRQEVRQVGPQGLRLPLATEEAGEYLLTVRDAAGTLLASVPYAVAGERPLAPGAELVPGKMRLRLDKADYAAGETIRLAMSLPYDGTGLITLERDGVAAFAWFTAAAGDTVQEIAIPANFEGRGYVNVSFVRAGDAGAVYMTPHSYAVAPFTAAVRQRDMRLSIEAPDSVLPGSSLRVTLRAEKPGKAVLFAVDEGVLQLTGFATPSPLAGLLTDRALEVRTLQALDLLMPRRVSAFGGGMDGGNGGGRFQNPFKRREEPPLATWSSLLDVTPEGVTVEIPVPAYYNGKLRLMAVGASADCAGSAERAGTAVAPLVLTPQLPLTVSPGDSFEGALVLANTTDQPVRVEVAATADTGLAFSAAPPSQAEVGPQAEVVLPFRLRATDRAGAADVRFTARCGDSAYERTASLSVRPASPLRTSLQVGSATQSAELPVERDVLAFGARSTASLSAQPLPLVRGFAAYLHAYPYGCTEQLISRAFARLLLRDHPGLFPDEKQDEDLLEAAMNAIGERLTRGGVAPWPGGRPDPLLTVYAADFLLAMREAGRGGADDLLQRLCDAVERLCPLNSSSLAAARISAYGIWVLTREGRVTTQLLENLQDGLAEYKVADWETDLTAVFVASSRKQMFMSADLRPDAIVCRPAGWFDELAQRALLTTLLARHFPEFCTDALKADLFDAVAQAVKGGRYATFSAAQGARALLSIGGGTREALEGAELVCVDGEGEARRSLPAGGALLSVEQPQCRRYALKMPAASPRLFWQIATTGYDARSVDGAAAHGIEISRDYLDAQGRPVRQVRQGDVLTVRITVRGQKRQIPDCVVSDLLPGGCEMVLARGSAGGERPPRGLKFADRRDDRMLLFADVDNEPLVYTYRIRAVNRGTFAIPPAYVEAMYDQGMYGHSAGGSLEILP